jgi:all-trans-retinol 13,14-reductase
MQPYDIIVIGSGMGGLTFASLMAQMAHKRVLVLEHHFKLGGFTHTFTRKGYTWDVGLHYVGGMNKGTSSRTMCDFVTHSAVKWHKLPGAFEQFVYPDFTFVVTDDPKEYLHDLIQQFPAEETGLRRYFRDVRHVANWCAMETWSWSSPGWLAWPLRLATMRQRTLALMTTKHYLDQRFADERLKALLTSQWGDYGLPPDQSAFAIHALVANSYLQGAWYPEGSAKTIASSMVPIIEEAGGTCLVNHDVVEILVENGSAKGVRVLEKRGKQVEEKTLLAPLVVSDVGAYSTLTKLLPEQVQLPWRLREDLEDMPKGNAPVILFVGLKESPVRLGFHGENHWIFSGYDHDDPQANGLQDGQAMSAYLSFPSLKDPSATQHTAEIISSVDYQTFFQWQNTTWKHRGEAYEHLKADIGEALLSLVERHYPGFRELVAYQEVATPLTFEGFAEQYHEGIYGLPATPERFRRRWFGAQTPVRGLLLTGTDVCSLGIEGAMMGGAFTAGYALGPLGFLRVMSRAQVYSRTLHVKPVPALSRKIVG